MRRAGQALRYLRRNQQGTTLVEVAVTLVLSGILMAAVTAVLSSGIRMHGRMTAVSQAETVANLLLEKMTGELSRAGLSDAAESGDCLWMEQDQNARWLAFLDRDGRLVTLCASTSTEEEADLENPGSGQLRVRYAAMPEAGLKEENWHYDRQVYLGYQIESLTFSRDDPDRHPDVVRIDLTLKHGRSGFTCHTFRYVKM